MTEEISKVFWQQVNGSRYARSLTSRMLSERGDEIFSVTPLVGLPQHQKMKVFVIYDRTYVIQWLIAKVIQKLQLVKKEQLMELVNEAWEKSREYQSNSMDRTPNVTQVI